MSCSVGMEVEQLASGMKLRHAHPNGVQTTTVRGEGWPVLRESMSLSEPVSPRLITAR